MKECHDSPIELRNDITLASSAMLVRCKKLQLRPNCDLTATTATATASAFSCLSSFYLIIIIIIIISLSSSFAFRALHFLGFASVFGLGSAACLGWAWVAFFVIVQALGK